jgi:hypothetical protein
MNTDPNNKFLRFGDLITIIGTSSHPKNNDATGFLSAVGFTDRRIFFQMVPSENLQTSVKQTFSLSKSNEGI